MWEAKYMARARAKGWQSIMKGSTVVPATGTANMTDVQLKVQEKNEEGYADLILSMEDEVCFNVVNEARTNDLPDGSLKKAWDNLHAKYAPSTKGELVELKRAFMGLTLESGKDPKNI